MALRMEIQTSAGGSFTEVDLAEYKLYDFKLKVSYTHATQLTFKANAPNHTYPLGIRNFVRFWDDAGTLPDGTAQSSSAPLFEGFIEDVDPGSDTREVTITCFDPTVEVGREFKIRSGAWVAGSGTEAPFYGANTYSRLVFNSKIAADDDSWWEREHSATVGRIIKLVMDDQYEPLHYWNAANSPAYDIDELNAMTFEPQQKVVFDTTTMREGLTRLINRWCPKRKLLWRPGVRQWRFPDLTASAQRLLVLNSSNGRVLSIQLDRSIEGRYTAIRFEGPVTATLTSVTLGSGGLTDLSDDEPLQSNPPTCCNVVCKNRWQITDPALRSFANRLPYPVLVQLGDYQIGITEYPTLLGYWPNNTEVGQKGWKVIAGWYWEDKSSGIIALWPNGICATRENRDPSSGNPVYENPTDIMFVYGLASSPLQLRVPATGFEGTAYTVANIFNEETIYDEMLAAYYDRHVVITTPSRIAKYRQLGQDLLDISKDILYSGSAVLDGINYDYAWLDRRVNVTAVDKDGSPVSTGWESINAFLTDVEYDFTQQLTTLTFNSNQAEILGMDVETQKAFLKIKAVEMRQLPVFATFSTSIRNRRIGEGQGSGFSRQWSVHETTYSISGGGMEFYDPTTGAVER